MIITDLNALKPGMMLAEPVYDLHHSLLLKAGVALDERRIRLLRSWGAGRVVVRTAEADGAETPPRSVPVPAVASEDTVAVVQTDQGPLMGEIARVAAVLAMEKNQRADSAQR